MGLFSLFKNNVDNSTIEKKISEGAIIIDVRTEMEYKMGNVKGSKNIPLQTIADREEYIKNLKKPIIFCCASGARSGQATNYFKNRGVDALNGGSWKSLKFVEKKV